MANKQFISYMLSLLFTTSIILMVKLCLIMKMSISAKHYFSPIRIYNFLARIIDADHFPLNRIGVLRDGQLMTLRWRSGRRFRMCSVVRGG